MRALYWKAWLTEALVEVDRAVHPPRKAGEASDANIIDWCEVDVESLKGTMRKFCLLNARSCVGGWSALADVSTGRRAPILAAERPGGLVRAWYRACAAGVPERIRT